MRSLKNLTMRLAAGALNQTGGAPFSEFYGGLGHILMFHRVQAEISGNRIWANAYEVTADFLEEVILYFKRHGYFFASLDEIAECLNEHRRFVSFTFDDGFKDNLEVAYPVLRRHGVPMTVFVTTGFPDHTAVLWRNALERLLLERDRVAVSLGGRAHDLDLATSEKKQTAFGLVADHIENSSDGTIEDRIGSVCAQFGIDPIASVRELALSWDGLLELSRLPNVSIGAHTVSHPVLSRLDHSESRFEIAESKRLLEQRLGRDVLHFAYPYGGRSEITERDAIIAQGAGFKTAVTTCSSNVHRAHLDLLFHLPRIGVGMSMTSHTFDLIRHGVIPLIRCRGRRVARID